MNSFYTAVVLLGYLVLFGNEVFARRAVVEFRNQGVFRQLQNLSQQHINLQSINQPESQKQTFENKIVNILSSQGLKLSSSQVDKTLDQLDALILKDVTDEQIVEISKNINVKSIEPEVIHPLPFEVEKLSLKLNLKLNQSFLEEKNTASNNDNIENNQEYVVDDEKIKSKTPWGITAVKAREAWNLSDGGKGVRVMVLDTGIDRNHPSIRPNFEQGKSFIYDEFTRSVTNTSKPPKPPPVLEYPYQDTIGHGTHVSGTIAGALDSSGFSGVAPKATLLMGKVCVEGGCPSISIIEGINWAIKQKVDIINMSIASATSTAAEKRAITKAIKANITIVAAAGNNGSNQVSYPAAFPEVIAVGAVSQDFKRAGFSQYGPELSLVAPGVDVVSSVPVGTGREPTVEFSDTQGNFLGVKNKVVHGSKSLLTPEINNLVCVGLGKAKDFSNKDLTGKYALIQRGEIKFSEKVENAIKANAEGVIIFNNEEGLINASLDKDGGEVSIGVFQIEQVVGESLKSRIGKGESVYAKLSIAVSNFSTFQGTSMATPHVAGVATLMKAVNKKLNAGQMKFILTRTATPILGVDSENQDQYGAGFLNAEKAVGESAKLLETTVD